MPEPINIAMIERINQRFFLASLAEEEAPELDPFGAVTEGLERLGIEVPEELRSYVDGLPVAIGASLLAVAATAARESIPLTFAWLAGYDHELTVAQADRGGNRLVTVILRGPSPSDVGSGAASA